MTREDEIRVPILGDKHAGEEDLHCCGLPTYGLVWQLLHALFFMTGGTTFIAGREYVFHDGAKASKAHVDRVEAISNCDAAVTL